MSIEANPLGGGPGRRLAWLVTAALWTAVASPPPSAQALGEVRAARAVRADSRRTFERGDHESLETALQEVDVIRPDLSSRPLQLTVERELPTPPEAIYHAWTAGWDRWFAAPGTVTMRAEVGMPYFFETRFEGQRHPHYGRFLRLEPGRLVEMSWLTEMGTRGAETVVTLALEPRGEEGTSLTLTHAGFPDETSRDGHIEGWELALDSMARALGSDERRR